MLPKRLTQQQARKVIFIPEDLVRVYEWQEGELKANRVTDIKKYHRRKARFLNSERGKTFLSCKKKKVGEVHGIDIWLVDGYKLRSGRDSGDVDFTMGGHGYRYLYIPHHEIWIDSSYYRTKDYWPIIWHEYIERVLMRNGLAYVNSHTIASRLEIVLRDDHYFVLPVGTHRQNHAWTCGPASLKIVLDYLRYPVSEYYLAKLCKTTRRHGTDPVDLVNTARKLKFTADDRRYLSPSKVKKLVHRGIPIIANYQLTPDVGEGHYAVIMGYSRNSYVISNPALDKGYEVVPIKEFHKNWYELEDATVAQGIIVQNIEPK